MLIQNLWIVIAIGKLCALKAHSLPIAITIHKFCISICSTFVSYHSYKQHPLLTQSYCTRLKTCIKRTVNRPALRTELKINCYGFCAVFYLSLIVGTKCWGQQAVKDLWQIYKWYEWDGCQRVDACSKWSVSHQYVCCFRHYCYVYVNIRLILLMLARSILILTSLFLILFFLGF